MAKNIQEIPYTEITERALSLGRLASNAIEKVRQIVGATNPEEAEPTTIRGSYGRILTSGIFENVIHASSETKDAQREIKLWFRPDELVFDLYPTKPSSSNHHPTRDWA